MYQLFTVWLYVVSRTARYVLEGSSFMVLANVQPPSRYAALDDPLDIRDSERSALAHRQVVVVEVAVTLLGMRYLALDHGSGGSGLLVGAKHTYPMVVVSLAGGFIRVALDRQAVQSGVLKENYGTV